MSRAENRQKRAETREFLGSARQRTTLLCEVNGRQEDGRANLA
jgi:hypothetical protein